MLVYRRIWLKDCSLFISPTPVQPRASSSDITSARRGLFTKISCPYRVDLKIWWANKFDMVTILGHGGFLHTLVSSKTVLRFSIQSVSTGPSMTIQCQFTGDSSLLILLASSVAASVSPKA